MHPLARAACSPNTRASHAALTQPGRYQFPALSTRVPIGRPVALTWLVHTCQARAGDSRRCTRRCLALPVRAHRERFNGTVLEFDSCAVLAFDFRVGRSEPGAPALLTATLCPDRGTAEPSCTPLRVPRAAQAPVHRSPRPASPSGTSSLPRARAYPSAALSPSRGWCTRVRLGLATPGVVRDDVWLYQYVLFESVPTVPSSSSPASVLASGFRVGRSEPGAPAPSHRHPLP